VPAVLDDLLDPVPAGAPLRTAVVAGAALPDRVAERAGERGVAVTEYYGAAELSFLAARRLPDPVLRPIPGVRVRLGPDGVLWARSPYLALGYAGSGSGALRLDGDGFATVGDLAATADRQGDPPGGLLIRGRGESAIVSGGFTVLAEDVEAALSGIPGVRAVAVVGLPHARLGEVVTAVLELEPGADPDDARSCARARARAVLSGSARPRRYLVVDALPRVGGGKVARAALRETLLG
jgi:acyl-CoA synthetase (AMP-forming)/AMP-acid ligase II